MRDDIASGKQKIRSDIPGDQNMVKDCLILYSIKN